MAKSYKTPGVFIEEIPLIPPTIAAPPTALPAFIGYTQKADDEQGTLINKPVSIHSMPEFEARFGLPETAQLHFSLRPGHTVDGDIIVAPSLFRLHFSMQLFYANGGGDCYIISAGDYEKAMAATSSEKYDHFKQALDAAAATAGITLLLFPDASLLCSLPFDPAQAAAQTVFYHRIYKDALQQCALLRTRFLIADVFKPVDGTLSFDEAIELFRDNIGDEHLQFGAAYYPALQTAIPVYVDERSAAAIHHSGPELPAGICLKKEDAPANDPLSIFHSDPVLYQQLVHSFRDKTMVMPASPAIAGIYATTDNNYGVWKAPANIALSAVQQPMIDINDGMQDGMNVTASGKSINAIRRFTGKGTLVWGARTLAGNDNEYRYVSVKRFLMMIETAIEQAMLPFVFEPNDANTWVRIKAMIENFLYQHWRSGGLMGIKPEAAYFVHAGLGNTMTQQDIIEGRLRIEIGVAPVRPSEFIILQFVQMQQS